MQLNLIVPILFFVVTVLPLHGPSASNLKTDKLFGNVKSVRTEQTWVENDVESNRVLMTVEAYDKVGNKTEWNAYMGSEKPLRSLFTYGEKDKVTEQAWFNSADDLTAKTAFKYNSQGNLVEELSSNGIKVLYSYDSQNNRTLKRSFDLATNEGPRMFGDVNGLVRYSYDKKNNLLEVASFKPSGSRVWNPELQAHRIVYSYDSKGRIRSQTVFNAKNYIRTKTHFAYDEQDRIVKESVFAGKTRSTMIYGYIRQVDTHGNWIVQVKTKQANGNRSGNSQVVETIYRTIEYWN